MPRGQSVPCADCGRLMWRGGGSLPVGQARCHPCRRAFRPSRPLTGDYVCRACSETVKRPLTRGQAPKWCPTCRASGKRPKACEACGAIGVHNGCRTCSRICGVYIRAGRWPSSPVPDRHPSRSTPVPSDHPSRHREPTYASFPVWYGDCEECGKVFSSNTPVKVYCSKLCSKRVGKRARRGREHGDGDSFRWTQVITLFLKFDRCCAYCREPIDGQPDPDHVVALSRGGHNTISNILPACRACNCDKQNLTLEEWAEHRRLKGKPPVITAWDLADSRYTHLALRHATPRAA